MPINKSIFLKDVLQPPHSAGRYLLSVGEVRYRRLSNKAPAPIPLKKHVKRTPLFEKRQCQYHAVGMGVPAAVITA